MKKTALLLICALGFFSFVCYGEDSLLPADKGLTLPPASHPPTLHPKKIIKSAIKPLEIKGKVDTLILAEPSKGIRPEITIISTTDSKENPLRQTFLVRSTTTIYSPEWKAIALDKLEKGSLVRVQYIKNKEGMLVALSIKPLATKN